MDFIATWRHQITDNLAKCAALAKDTQEAELEFALMATGVLMPLKAPAQNFNMEAIGAVNKLLGSRAKYVLKEVQSWQSEDLMAVAQAFNERLQNNQELETAVNLLVNQFEASAIFGEQSPPVENSAFRQSSDTRLVDGETATIAISPRVFISYARSDGEDLARKLRQQLEQEGIPVWQDRVKMVGGRDWWLQITEAINQVEFMVLVATPGALRSEVVRKEWRYARQQGVCVVPVQGVPNLAVKLLPRWMRAVHFYHPVQEWQKLVQNLNAPCTTARVPFMVEELPDDFVPRAAQTNQLVAALLSENGDPMANTVALSGAGGYGKTMLVRAICHNEALRHAFDAGILWVTLGETPGDLTERVVDLIEVLTGERPGFAGLDAAGARLEQLLAGRDILMVLDDVWHVAHLKPFLQGGARCARLITTKNISSLPAGAHHVEVASMTRLEAVALLNTELPEGPPGPLEFLAERLGGWPLLLRLTNGTLRDRVYNNRQPLSAALRYVNKALDKRGLTAFDAHNAASRDQAVGESIGISQDLLTDDERARYSELAIFPAHARIPLSVLQKLWGATGDLNGVKTETLCNRLYQLSLLAQFEPNEQYIKLQNMVRKHLARQHGKELPALHRQFLDACAAELATGQGDAGDVPNWSSLAHTETYLWANLAYHLVAAQRTEQLARTVKDINYLVVKTYLDCANAAEADLLIARQSATDDSLLSQLHQAYSQSNHLLSECNTLEEVAGTLHSRIAHLPAMASLIPVKNINLTGPLITSARRLPDLPDSSLIRTLTGHTTVVLGCDISANGATVVSIDRKTMVRVWDTQTGAERFMLDSHQIMGSCCAISADAAVIVSASWDGALKIWDGTSGAERFSIEAHSDPIFSVAISADGSVAVSASRDRTVKIWNTQTGTERFTLTGHERSVTGCDISPDGTTVISNSADGTVRIWDATTGRLKTTLAAYPPEVSNPAANLTFTASTSTSLSCAISADKRTVVSSMPDGLIKVWDMPAGNERLLIQAHSGWVEDCAISADGQLITTVSNNKIIKGWDTISGDIRFTLEGHNRGVTCCAISANGKIIVSGAQDKLLKLWDAGSNVEQSSSPVYSFATHRCAVSADGQLAAFDAPPNVLQVLDAQTGAERFTLQGHARPVTACAISVDSKLIVTASQDRTLKIWDAETGSERQTLAGHAWAVNDCVFSAGGTRIVSVSDDSAVKVWDVQTGAELFDFSGHARGVNSCAIASDSSFVVSAAADKTLKGWGLQTGRERFSHVGHTAQINCCAVSPDNLFIASASNDNTIKIWNSQTGEEQLTLDEHSAAVQWCAFHPDKPYLLSVSKDRTVRLWNYHTKQCLSTLRVDGALSGCAWYPDGRRILVVGSRGAYFLQVVR